MIITTPGPVKTPAVSMRPDLQVFGFVVTTRSSDASVENLQSLYKRKLRFEPISRTPADTPWRDDLRGINWLLDVPHPGAVIRVPRAPVAR